MSKNKSYLYRHIRLDKQEPFYIGIGTNSDGYKRPYQRAFEKDKNQRKNKIYQSIISKTDIDVEIMLDNLTYEEAKKKEIEFISMYGKIINGGCLANLTDGGDGCVGFKLSDSHKEKISIKAKERFRDEDYIEKYRIGKSNRRNSEKTREKFVALRKMKRNRPKGVSFKLPAEKVVQLTEDNLFIMVYDSISSTGRHGYIPTCISKVCKGKSRYHYGYRWVYLKDYINE
jgi:quinol monooxygenase YgiN